MTAPADPSPPPGRILMTTDTVGGVWDYSLELCRALGRSGVEVVLAAMGPPMRRGQRIEAAGVSNVELLESRFRLEWMDDPWADVDAAGTWLELVEAQFAPDLIHLNGFVHAALPWSAPVLVVAHSDVLSWWESVRGGPAPARWCHYAGRVGRGLRAADLVVAPTAAMLAAITRHYGPLRATRVIHNGRDAQRYVAREKEAFILCAGRLWDEAKNARLLAAVAPEVPWPIRLAGDPVDPSGRRAELRNVELLGPLPPGDLAGLLARASIYALPARYEPFGLTALEAGLAGCALVLGDIPTLRELWGDAAEYVPPHDQAALRDTLTRLITDSERRAGLAGRAFRRAEHYTVDRMLHGYLAAYAEAARTPQPLEPESAPSPA